MKDNNVVYRFKSFKVIKKYNHFLIINTRKPFEDGHTHVEGDLDTCIAIIKTVYNEEEPMSRNIHFLTSLMRLSSNRKYRLKIDELIKCIEYGVP
jgi:hypothetical protein